MAKRCTVYGPRHPEELYVEDFLDVVRRLDRIRRDSEGKSEEEMRREEEWRKFAERYNDPEG